MEATYSISTLIKSNHAGEDKALIYLRVTVNGERAEISIKRSVDRNRWDAAANRVRGNKEDAREINTLLDNTILKLNKIYNKLLQNDEVITARRIKDIYLGKDETKKTLLEAFAEHNQMMASRVGVDFSRSTYTRYTTTKDHVAAFLKHRYNLEDINLQRLQYAFITDFEHFLKVVRKCNHNSTLKYIRNFRKIINLAIKNDWLDKDPFKAYQVKLKDTKRTFLNKEELTRVVFARRVHFTVSESGTKTGRRTGEKPVLRFAPSISSPRKGYCCGVSLIISSKKLIRCSFVAMSAVGFLMIG